MQIEITLTLPLTRLLWISICTNLNLNLILLFFYPHPPSKGWVNSYSFTISKISNSLLSENLLFHPHMRVEKYFSTPIQGWKSTFPPSYESEKLNLLFDPIWGWKSTSPPIWGWKSTFIPSYEGGKVNLDDFTYCERKLPTQPFYRWILHSDKIFQYLDITLLCLMFPGELKGSAIL